MSPKRLSQKFGELPPVKKWLVSTAAIISALAVVTGAVVPIVRPYAKNALIAALDSQYVAQQSYQRKVLVDSLKHDRELEIISSKLAVVDTIKFCLKPRNRHSPVCE